MKKLLLLFAAIFMAAGFANAQDDAPLYTAMGETGAYTSWGENLFPTVTNIKVEAYEGYIIVRGFAGVEGHDMMVEFDEEGNFVSITSIVNGEEGDPVTKGYFKVPTGREDIDNINIYVSKTYCFGEIGENSGYILLGCYIGSDWAYYYLTWPMWANPFEGEATLLYTAVAKTSDVDEEDHDAEDAWGLTIFPTVENIKVDVYDKYIYIHALGGVEGYDAKVAYSGDEDEAVISVVSIVNGEESEPAKSTADIPTGREDYVTISAYLDGYSYAASDNEAKSGYITLGAYLIDAAGNSSDWNYYNISWSGGEDAAISSVIEDGKTNGAIYNLAGQKADAQYKGIVIKNGKKQMVK